MEIQEEERPREKATRYGIAVLQNRELLAILLRSGCQGKSALELADEVLRLRNDLPKLTTLTLAELCQLKGIKEAKALEILACFELSKRMSEEKMRHKVMINSPSSLNHWLNMQIGYQEQEHFMVLFLNIRNEILSHKSVFIGESGNCNVSVKEVYTLALREGACKIILVHNHPSGNVQPSDADIHITRRFIEAGKICGIECLDHVIVSHNLYFSFKEEQMFSNEKGMDL